MLLSRAAQYHFLNSHKSEALLRGHRKNVMTYNYYCESRGLKLGLK